MPFCSRRGKANYYRQQLVRYSGAFSNVRRAQVNAAAGAVALPAEPQLPNHEDSSCADEFGRRRRSSWARLIKKVYEADPLVCPRCSGPLKIISLIGEGAVIEKILRHLKLWDRPKRPPPAPPDRSIHYDPDIAGYQIGRPSVTGDRWPPSESGRRIKGKSVPASGAGAQG